MPEAKVTYTGAPKAEPDMPRGLPQINVQTPHIDFTDAMGRAMNAIGHATGTLGKATESMGAAWSQMGHVMDKTGNELYSRAVALQEITNQTATNEVQAAYQLEQGMADKNFHLLEGNNAAGQLEKYTKDTEERRTKFRNTLTNDAQKRAFDERTLQSMGRSIIAGSMHAGQQQKAAYMNSLDADISSWRREVQEHAFDDQLYDNARKGLEDSIRKKNAAKGNDESVTKKEVDEQLGKLLADRLNAQAKERPFEAWKRFNDPEINKQMDATTREQLKHSIMEQMRTTGAMGAGSRVVEDYGKGKPDLGYTIDQRVDDAVKSLPEELKDDLETKRNIRRFIEEKHRDWHQQEQIRQYNNMNDVLRILTGVDSPNGRPPKDMNEFLANPKAAQAFEGSDEATRAKIKEAVWQANIRGLRVDPQTSSENKRTWLGMYWNDRLNFMEKMKDPTVLFGQMNEGDRNAIIRLYEKAMKDPTSNAQVNQAYSWLRQGYGTVLNELGVDRWKKGENDTEWHNLHGAIFEALNEWEAAHPGKKITRNEFDKEIAPNLLKRDSGSFPYGWFGFGKEEQEPYWKGPVPEEWATKRKLEIMQDQGIAESDIPPEQIQRDYLRHMFRESVEGRGRKGDISGPMYGPPRPRRGGQGRVQIPISE